MPAKNRCGAFNFISVTSIQPITGEIDSDYLYLRNSEYCNEPSLNHFMMGTVTFDDKFSSLGKSGEALIKVLSNYYYHNFNYPFRIFWYLSIYSVPFGLPDKFLSLLPILIG